MLWRGCVRAEPVAPGGRRRAVHAALFIGPLLAVQGLPSDGVLCLWWYHEGNKALRRGDWKIAQARGGPWELFDLKTDRSEMHDLSARHPEVLAELRDQWEAMARSFRERLEEAR